MRGKYTFTVSSLKVADDLCRNFILGGPIPSDVVQFDDLVEPLSDKPVFFQDVDPIAYFRRLTRRSNVSAWLSCSSLKSDTITPS